MLFRKRWVAVLNKTYSFHILNCYKIQKRILEKKFLAFALTARSGLQVICSIYHCALEAPTTWRDVGDSEVRLLGSNKPFEKKEEDKFANSRIS